MRRWHEQDNRSTAKAKYLRSNINAEVASSASNSPLAGARSGGSGPATRPSSRILLHFSGCRFCGPLPHDQQHRIALLRAVVVDLLAVVRDEAASGNRGRVFRVVL